MLISGFIYLNNKQQFIDEIPSFFRKVPVKDSEKFVIDFQFEDHCFVVKHDTCFEETFFYEVSDEPKELPFCINDKAVAQKLGEFLSKKFQCFVYIWNQEVYFDAKIEDAKVRMKSSKVVTNYLYYQNGMACTQNAQPLINSRTLIYKDPSVMSK